MGGVDRHVVRDECQKGFGYFAASAACIRCLMDECESCRGGDPWHCIDCSRGFGVTPSGRCERCGDFCRKCDAVGSCKDCEDGFALENGRCWSCGNGCKDCQLAGPGLCDICYPPNFELENRSRTCRSHVEEI